jgi:hypothetical protein
LYFNITIGLSDLFFVGVALEESSPLNLSSFHEENKRRLPQFETPPQSSPEMGGGF